MVFNSFQDAIEVLATFLKNHDKIFLKTYPEIVDFRHDFTGRLILLAGDDGVDFPIPQKSFNSFVGIVATSIFQNKTLYTWDIKKIFTYFYHRLVRPYLIDITSTIIDLKYGETFLGINNSCPESFHEADKRATHIQENNACWHLHQNLHIPLATRVLPKIETTGIVDTNSKQVRYAVYDIEGQMNGRLRCREAFPNALLAHNLKPEEKKQLRPELDHKFAVLDFKAMEVCVLQWLSKDLRLGKIISSGRDIYSTIYSLLYGTKCTEEQRSFIKRTFLPVVYGLQAESMSETMSIDLTEATNLIAKINSYFSTAMEWVGSCQQQAKYGSVKDYFGRERQCEKAWIARNAMIQGPAAAVCLEKLVDLTDRIRQYCEVVMTIHDAYVLSVPVSDMRATIVRAVEILEQTSKFLPELRLTVDVRVGDNLAELEKYSY